jgi:hypothetical protein
MAATQIATIPIRRTTTAKLYANGRSSHAHSPHHSSQYASALGSDRCEAMKTLASGCCILPRSGRCARPIASPAPASRFFSAPPSEQSHDRSFSSAPRIACDAIGVLSPDGLAYAALQDAPACRQRCARRRANQSSRVLDGGRVSQADAERRSDSQGAGTRAKRFIASTSVHAFELTESARPFCAAWQMGIESADSRRGSGRVGAEHAFPAAAPAAASQYT